MDLYIRVAVFCVHVVTLLIFKAKNDSRDPSPLTVYSYSLDEDFCTGNNPDSSYNWIDARWMGRIADSCKVVQ